MSIPEIHVKRYHRPVSLAACGETSSRSKGKAPPEAESAATIRVVSAVTRGRPHRISACYAVYPQAARRGASVGVLALFWGIAGNPGRPERLPQWDGNMVKPGKTALHVRAPFPCRHRYRYGRRHGFRRGCNRYPVEVFVCTAMSPDGHHSVDIPAVIA